MAVERFENIIDGRERLLAVNLTVELRRVPGEERVEAWLTGESSWVEALTVRPLRRVDPHRPSSH